jgi:hypothetical protein
LSRSSFGLLIRLATLLVPVVLAAIPATVAAAPPAAAASAHHRQHSVPTATPGTFVPVDQFRALDTGKGGGPMRAGHRLTVTLGGRHGIPAGAAAAAVTVHAVNPNTGGALTLFPFHSAAPATTNLTYQRGQTTAQAAVVRLSHGAFTVLDRARSGTMQLAVDVSGYFVRGTVGPQPGLLHLLSSPVRALDTRHPGGYFRPHSVRSLQVKHGVPTSGVGTVVVMLTAVDPAGSGSLVAYAKGNDQPQTPTTRFDAHRTTTSFAWVPTQSDGSISIANDSARGTGVLLDVVGWANAGVAQTAGAFEPRFPDRLVSGATFGAGRTRSFRIAGRAGVPLAHVSAVVASITASSAKRVGALLVGSASTNNARRAVEFGPGRKPADLIELPLANGALQVRNLSSGSVTIALDVLGFVPSQTLTPPTMSISRYLGDLTDVVAHDVAHDRAVMDGHGCSDAQAMAAVAHPVVLLDVGAQSVTGPELTSQDPGVALTQTVGTVRLDYPDLRMVLDSYLAAFHRCAPTATATIAIGTSNDGQWTKGQPNYYAPVRRGTNWAGLVVNRLGSQPGLTIVGADDVEPGFASTQAQAQAWENAYLAAASTKTLIFNGSADGCPDGFGDVGARCSKGYTEQGLYDLAHKVQDPTYRIDVTPQIYTPSMAAQWANIDKTGGGQLTIAGALTEHALASDTYSAANGWAALYYAVGSVTRSPHISGVSDITNG